MGNLMFYYSTGFKLFGRVGYRCNLAKFSLGLSIPFDLLMDFGRCIGNDKVFSVVDFLLMDFKQVPQFLLHDTALWM